MEKWPLADTISQPIMRWLAVVVLYGMRPGDSAAVQSLLQAKRTLGTDRIKLSVLLYDNTPGGCNPGPMSEDTRYESATVNGGLSAAYNRALAIALEERVAWLLILDQDTTLPPDYLLRMSSLVQEVEPDGAVGAIVPRMLDNGTLVSPVFIRPWGVSYLRPDFEGTSRDEIHATNSATLFRVAALKRIGGFSPYFWLDYVDGYVFRQLHLHGLRIYAAKDIQVDHELSLLHGGELKPDRFRNILRAESAFWDLYGSRMQRLALAIRLFGRIWRQRQRGHGASILQLTRRELRRRLLQSRRQRISDWMDEMEQLVSSRQVGENGQQLFEERPSVSVCMAVYNGERYIEPQLRSILNQLRTEDEVIVVDDGSSDRTREVVRSLGDRRIHLIEHSRNHGILRTFEEAIRCASGEVLFLSDQDDLWAPNKISAVLRAFQLCPEVDVAVSDASLIDEAGAPVNLTYYAQRGRFRPGALANLLRCTYLGCTMAFRSRLRRKILPFPVGAEILHDLWIGAVNSLSGGKALYLSSCLVHYRRHEENATGKRRLSLKRQIRMRFDLSRSLAGWWLKNSS